MGIYAKMVKAVRNPELVWQRLNRPFVQRAKDTDLDHLRVQMFDFLDQQFGCDARSLYAELQASDFKLWYKQAKREIHERANMRELSSDFDCEVLYLLIRAGKFEVVVETGVSYGGSSAHILEALAMNRRGRLYRIDLPVDTATNGLQGYLVRECVRDRWRLINGDAKIELPKLLEKLGHVDLFHHDSDHSYAHMMWEYNTALQYLGPNGLLTSHDVVSAPWMRNAFIDLCRRETLRHRVFRNLGIALLA